MIKLGRTSCVQTELIFSVKHGTMATNLAPESKEECNIVKVNLQH